MLKKITVSIVITCKDLHKYIDECMESIASQTLQPTEVIIIHDGCTEPPVFDHTITLHRPVNQGVALSRNDGFKISKGKYVLFVDADDMLAENFIELMVETLEETNADLAYPDCLLWSYWGDKERKPNKWHRAPDVLTHQAMYDKNEVVVTSMMKRTLFERVGGFMTMPLFEDWMFNLEALTEGAVYVKAPTCIKYRQRMNGRNRAPDELRNQVWNEIRDRFELIEGVLHEKKSA